MPPLLTAGAVLAGAAYLHGHDPNVPGHFPGCPWLALTGYYCPGCGTTRALYALTHGDVGTALARNPLTLLTVIWLALWWSEWLYRRVTGRPRTWMMPTRVLWGMFWVVLGFWVLRNIPGWDWLSPA